MDNIFANDLQYDISHNNLICNMLIEVLDKYQIQFALKTKI